MRAVILAAGQGSRLRPLTDDKPKCLVELEGRSLLDRQVEVLRSAGISDIAVVGGYRSDQIQDLGHHVIVNDRYDVSNMVVTLSCAFEWMTCGEDVIISYGDIVYESRVLDAVLRCEDPIGVAVDLQWKKYWELRLDDPLQDAETLLKDEAGYIREIGEKPDDYSRIQGQYMGLIKIGAEHIEGLKKAYRQMDRNALYGGKDFENMYMTSFLQYLIDVGWRVKAVGVENGWLEVDTIEDLNLYHSLQRTGELAQYYDCL